MLHVLCFDSSTLNQCSTISDGLNSFFCFPSSLLLF